MMAIVICKPAMRNPLTKVSANKHDRSRLDLLREQYRIPIIYLNQLSTRVCGREIRDFSMLSPTENREVIKYIKGHVAEIERDCRRF